MKNRHLSFLLELAKAYVGNILASFKEFPPHQRATNFSLDQVMEKMRTHGGAQ